MLFDNHKGMSISAKSDVGSNYTKFQTLIFFCVHNKRVLTWNSLCLNAKQHDQILVS